MGADIIAERTRGASPSSVAPATSAWRVASPGHTLRNDSFDEGLHYISEFRLQMDIKLHECYLALIKPNLLCIALHGLLLHYCCQSPVLGWVSTSSYLYV